MKIQVSVIFKILYIWPPVSVFLFLMLHLMLDGQRLFHKGDFCCFRCVFKSSILGGSYHFWGDPYLNRLLYYLICVVLDYHTV